MESYNNHQKTPKRKWTPVKRFRLTIAVLALLMLAIFFKILYVMVVEGDRWREIGSRLNPPELVVVNPIRGSIYDERERLVAVTAPYYRLFFDFKAPAFTEIPRDSMRMMLDSLATVISEKYAQSAHPVKKSDLLRQWQQGINKRSRYWPVYRYNVSYLEMEEMSEHFPLAPHKRGNRTVPSPFKRFINKQEQSSRMNPFGSLAMRTIGRVYGEKEEGLSKARNGLELAYDSLLRGKTGQAIRTYNGGKRNLNTIEEPVRGADVYATINMDVQSIVEEVLRRRLIDVDAGSGTCVLMEVQTGKILAISNLGRQSEGVYAETMNYALQDMSEPGSTFKTASLLVALNDGTITPESLVERGNGLWKVGGRTVRDHNANRGESVITASRALETSSNVGIAKIIYKYYSDNPDDYVQKIRNMGFGLDLKLEIQGYEKARVRKRSDNPNRWYGTTLAWMSYGYETQIPPIYTLAFYNAIANNGKYMRPYFVNRVVDAKGNTIVEHKPTVLIDSIANPQAIRDIQEMLYNVVWKGTGKPVQSNVVSVSGKTGTAQLAGGGGKGYHAGATRYQVSFVGYFPSEKPKYTCIAVVREPNPSRAYPGGGNVTGPIVRDIAERLVALESPRTLDSLGQRHHPLPHQISRGSSEALKQTLRQQHIPYVEESSAKDSKWVNVSRQDREVKLSAMPVYKETLMPNVVGMSPRDATLILLRRGLRPHIIGYGNVKQQEPSAGNPIKPGMTVKIRLDYSDESQIKNDKNT